MNLFQAIQKRVEEIEKLLLGLNPAKLERIFQGLPFDIGHHHVGGVVLLEHRGNPHDVRMFELCECLGFADKPRKTQPKVSSCFADIGCTELSWVLTAKWVGRNSLIATLCSRLVSAAR